MSKQVEVPEGLRAAVANAMEARAAEAQRATDDGLDYLDLADVAILPIYKHFSDRLLSKEALSCAAEAAEAYSGDSWETQVRLAIEAAALQATSTPEVDRG
jgi:hypothetical protein